MSHDHNRSSSPREMDNGDEEQPTRPDSATGSHRDEEDDQQQDKYNEQQQQSNYDNDDQQSNYEQEKNYDHVKFEPVDPENFDTKSFFSNIDALSHKLHSDSLRSFDTETDFDVEELKSTVAAVTVSMENFKNYNMHSQAQLEKLREQIKEVKDRMYKKQSQHPYDRNPDHHMSVEERELEAKIQNLNKELSKATEELVRAQQASASTEIAASEAALVAEQAAEEAQKIQEEYEARRKQESENRKKEEERQKREEQEQQELERREEEKRQAEEARKAKLRKEEMSAPDWEKWPIFTYRVDPGDFDQGIGCLIRGNPNRFRENMVSCKLVDPLDSDYKYEDNEELVGNIILLEGSDTFENDAYVIIPHCTSRASAMNREPVIKAETADGWVELKSQEVSLNDYKDLKFVQAELKNCTKLAVVTRFKTDYLSFSKRGGTVHSNVDQRVTFTAPRGCFATKENFVLQLQPVDTATVTEIRAKPVGKDLFATSSFVSSEWSTTAFQTPIMVTVPVPPNPVKAKKAAAARAAKEAKMKNPHQNVPPPDDEEEQKKKREKRNNTRNRGRGAQTNPEEEEQTVTKKPTKWYMGQYGVQEEDENDILYFTFKDKKGKWHYVEDKKINPVRIDLVEFQLQDPNDIDKFLILRMKTTAEISDALELAKVIEDRLTERTVNVILKQRNDNPCDAIIEVVHHNKLDKVLDRLVKEGYEDGPGISKDIILKEGDRLGIDFRSNIKCADENTNLDFIFNSQLSNFVQFELSEVNRYLQKNHSLYMGCVQLLRKRPVVCIRQKPKKDKKKAANVKKTEEQDLAEHEEDVDEHQEEEEMTYIEFEKELLNEQLINIPKEQELLDPVTVKKAPVTLRNRDDIVNDETLRMIASELGTEWQKVSHYLNVKKTRIQAILRNTMAQEKSEEDAKFEMLMNWAKKVPKSLNKVDVLSKALMYGGREDLAADLKDMDNNFQRERKGQSTPVNTHHNEYFRD